MPQRKCNDETCPCQDDGDSCHYVATETTPAWPLPPGVKLLEEQEQQEKTYGPGWPD